MSNLNLAPQLRAVAKYIDKIAPKDPVNGLPVGEAIQQATVCHQAANVWEEIDKAHAEADRVKLTCHSCGDVRHTNPNEPVTKIRCECGCLWATVEADNG